MVRSEHRKTLRAARQGNRAAWEYLYRQHAPAVLGYLRTQYPQMADDLLGETFLNAVRDIHSFSGSETELRRWLLRIAHNRLIDMRRADQSRPQSATSEIPDIEHTDEGFESVLHGGGSVHQLAAMLEPLPPDQRAVVYLRYVLDQDQKTTAAILEMSVPAVKMAQQRALNRLAEYQSVTFPEAKALK